MQMREDQRRQRDVDDERVERAGAAIGQATRAAQHHAEREAGNEEGKVVHGASALRQMFDGEDVKASFRE